MNVYYALIIFRLKFNLLVLEPKKKLQLNLISIVANVQVKLYNSGDFNLTIFSQTTPLSRWPTFYKIIFIKNHFGSTNISDPDVL